MADRRRESIVENKVQADRDKMLSGAINDVDVESYEKEFAFLKLNKIKGLDNNEIKRRYIFAYYIYQFMILSIIATTCSILLCIVVFYSTDLFVSAIYDSKFNVLSIWPWNQNQELQLEFVGRLSGPDQRRFLVSCSTVSAIWIVFVAFVVFIGVMNGNKYSALGKGALIFWLIASLLMWFFSSIDLFTYSSMGPSIFDGLAMLTVKKCSIISFTYWLSGYFLFLALAKFKYSISLEPK